MLAWLSVWSYVQTCISLSQASVKSRLVLLFSLVLAHLGSPRKRAVKCVCVCVPYVQCTKNRLTCENYTANYKIFQEHQLNSVRFPVFPEAISNSGRFPGVVNTLVTIAGRRSYKSFQQQTSVGCGRGHTPVLR